MAIIKLLFELQKWILPISPKMPVGVHFSEISTSLSVLSEQMKLSHAMGWRGASAAADSKYACGINRGSDVWTNKQSGNGTVACMWSQVRRVAKNCYL